MLLLLRMVSFFVVRIIMVSLGHGVVYFLDLEYDIGWLIASSFYFILLSIKFDTIIYFHLRFSSDLHAHAHARLLDRETWNHLRQELRNIESQRVTERR